MKRYLICLAIIGAMLGAFLVTSGQKGGSGASGSLAPAEVINAFYQACKTRSYDSAKSYLSAASIAYFNAQEQQDKNKSFNAFVDYCSSNLNTPEFVSIRAENERINSNTALVDTAFVYKDNDPSFVPHHLVRDDGWHLDMVSTFEQISTEPANNGYRQELARRD